MSEWVLVRLNPLSARQYSNIICCLFFFFFLEDQNEGLILGIAGVLISFFAIIRSICNSILSWQQNSEIKNVRKQ